jgi:hypothetical protein
MVLLILFIHILTMGCSFPSKTLRDSPTLKIGKAPIEASLENAYDDYVERASAVVYRPIDTRLSRFYELY